MIEAIRYDDVTRLRLWTRRSAAVGYDVSMYVVRDVLIDTGFPHVWRDVEQAVRALRPAGAIVTHWHEDHAGNAPTLAPMLPLWMPSYTQMKLRERQQVKFYRHFTWGRPKALVADITDFDPGILQCIATPGHSPDHHVVFDPRTRTLFSADLWLGVRVRVVGSSENPYEIIASLERAIALEPDRMFDAHRGLVTRPVLALRAKKGWLQDVVGNIEQRLGAGQADAQILKEALDGDEFVALLSQGEYSRRNLVRAVRRQRQMLTTAGSP